MAKTTKAQTASNKSSTLSNDTLANSLAEKLNSGKTGKVAFFLNEADAPSDLNEFVSTGSALLNIAATDRIDGGFPVGRISEVMGLEGTGKSLIACHAIADTQRKGGLAVFIDTENAVSKEFMTTLGVDIHKLVYAPIECIEDVFEAMETIITQVRTKSQNRLVTIIVDSVAAATTKIEQAADFERDGYATTKALVMSKGLRKITNLIGRERICVIFTNQLRENPGAMFGDKYRTPGGRALPFHASLRLRVESIGRITKQVEGAKHIIGIDTKVTVKKTRMAAPHRSVLFGIYFDSGIDDYNSWLEFFRKMKKVEGKTKKGSLNTGTNIWDFEVKDWPMLMNTNEEMRVDVLNYAKSLMVLQEKIDPLSINADEVVTDEEED